MTAATDDTLAGLLRAVIAAPADDLPRMVYADRLDELGEHDRAEFIRVQCELALPEPECEAPAFTGRGVLACAEWNGRHPGRDNWCYPCDVRRTLRERERALWKNHSWKWFDPFDRKPTDTQQPTHLHWTLPSGEVRAVVRRGFVGAVSVPTLTAWTAAADRLRTAAPVEEVRLGEWPEPWDLGTGWIVWWRAGGPQVDNHATLPAVVFDRLTRSRYDTRADALGDFAAALANAYPDVRIVLPPDPPLPRTRPPAYRLSSSRPGGPSR